MFHAKEWKSNINPKGTPFQIKGGDCGVHVCFIADHLTLDIVLQKQSLEGMILYRERIADALLKGRVEPPPTKEQLEIKESKPTLLEKPALKSPASAKSETQAPAIKKISLQESSNLQQNILYQEKKQQSTHNSN